MRKIILVLLIFLAACAPKEKKETIPDPTIYYPPVKTIANIPYGCEPLSLPGQEGQLVIGTHEFSLNNLKQAVAFDCGTREGRRCYFYLSLDASGQTDRRCD